MRRFLIVVLAFAVSACAGGGWTRPASETSCEAWLARLSSPERTALARGLLEDLWSSTGAVGRPDAAAVGAFADAIGGVCRGAPDAGISVADVGRAVVATLDDVAPPGALAHGSSQPPAPGLDEPDEPIVVTVDGVRQAEIELSEVEARDSYFGPAPEELAGAERVFIQLHVTYEAHVDGFAFSAADWVMAANGVPLEPARVANAPEPWLGSGRLARGQRASGYLVFDAPIRGEVVLSYQPGAGREASVVELVLRDAPREF